MITITNFLLSVAGFVNAAFLTFKHLTQQQACIIGAGCGKVILSDYGTFLGLPLGVYGLIFYSILLFFLTQPHLQLLQLMWIAIGAIVSVALMSIQFFIIKSFCIYCTFSAVIIFILLILNLKRGKHEQIN